MKKKLTVKDLRDLKGKKKLVSILVKNEQEALAANKVGFELLATGSPGLYVNPDNHPEFEEIIKIRQAAPYAFMHWGAADTLYSGLVEATRLAFKALEHGVDMFYCHNNFELIRGLFKQGIPGLGHVGLVPSRRTWTGGFKAVGKNAREAMIVYDQCLQIQDAGGVAIEMECVPYKVAEAITKKLTPSSIYGKWTRV
jgi:Ketopantoate hydroxymethyltransferase